MIARREKPDHSSNEEAARAPVTRGDVMAELRRMIIATADHLGLVVGRAGENGERAAGIVEEFLGFGLGDWESIPGLEPERVDLSRYGLTDLVNLAYDFAWQVGPRRNRVELEDTVYLLMLTYLRGGRPTYLSDATSARLRPDSALGQTLEAAEARQGLAWGNALDVRQLALLARMTEAATRASLSKEGIRTTTQRREGGLSTVSNDNALRWLKGRRGYVPTETTAPPELAEAPYRLTERDLDLILLEELSSDTGFLAWFAENLGLDKCELLSAEHSVSAKAGAKWGETDVLAFVESDGTKVAILIEDKIAADFTDRQAERYQERAAALVANGAADRSLTVLCAPQSYLDGVPEDDPWDRRISLETVLGWFESTPGFRAGWRARAMMACLARLSASRSAGSEQIRRFSCELRDYLISLEEGFDHGPTADRWGFIIRSDRTPAHVQIAWKNMQGSVDLSFSNGHVGNASGVEVPEGVTLSAAESTRQRSDIFKVGVPVADVTVSLHQQMDIISEVMAAIRKLLPLVEAVTGSR